MNLPANTVDKHLAQSILTLLLGAAYSDGQFSDEEKYIVFENLFSLNGFTEFTPEVQKTIIHNSYDELENSDDMENLIKANTKIISERGVYQKIFAIYAITSVIIADKTISEGELQYISSILSSI